MDKSKTETKDEPKKVSDDSLRDEDLKEVSGGFNPQPDPPGHSI